MDSLLLKQTQPPSSVARGTRCVTTLARNSHCSHQLYDRLKRRHKIAGSATPLDLHVHREVGDAQSAQTRLSDAKSLNTRYQSLSLPKKKDTKDVSQEVIKADKIRLCGADSDTDVPMTIFVTQKCSGMTVGLQISKHDSLC